MGGGATNGKTKESRWAARTSPPVAGGQIFTIFFSADLKTQRHPILAFTPLFDYWGGSLTVTTMQTSF